MMKLLVQTKDRTFRICGPELTGQGFMRVISFYWVAAASFWWILEKGLFPKCTLTRNWRFANFRGDRSAVVPLARCKKTHMQGSS